MDKKNQFNQIRLSFLDQQKRLGNLFDPEQIKQEKRELLQAKHELAVSSKVLEIIQAVSKGMQFKTKIHISGIVTKCLKTIFGDDTYEFDIEFKERANKTTAEIVFTKDGEQFDPKDEMGGGILEVAAFALRLSAIILSQPTIRRIMILDEPFKNIRGEEYRSRVKDLIMSLADELNVQFIINIDTDVYPEFEIGKVVRL